MNFIKGRRPAGLGLHILDDSARGDWGATAVEYGLMVALIAVVIAVVVGFFGTAVAALFIVPAGF